MTYVKKTSTDGYVFRAHRENSSAARVAKVPLSIWVATGDAYKGFLLSVLFGAALAGCSAGDVQSSPVDTVVGTAAEAIVYGFDGRTEYKDITDPRLKQRADATAGLVGLGGMSCSNGTCTLTGLQHYLSDFVEGDQQPTPLCPDVKFKGQWGEPYCSAELVGPDIFVTAGHCMSGAELDGPITCGTGGATVMATFGFNLQADGTSPTTLPQSDVYTCMSAVGRYTTSEDWAIFKVDRTVAGRVPMIAQYSGPLNVGTGLAVFGHGLGLPLKMSAGASVTVSDPADVGHYQTNADIFIGNSGGPSIDAVTGVAVGITTNGTGPVYYKTTDVNGNVCAALVTCGAVDHSGCGGWIGHTRMPYAAQQGKLALHPALVDTLI